MKPLFSHGEDYINCYSSWFSTVQTQDTQLAKCVERDCPQFPPGQHITSGISNFNVKDGGASWIAQLTMVNTRRSGPISPQEEANKRGNVVGKVRTLFFIPLLTSE